VEVGIAASFDHVLVPPKGVVARFTSMAGAPGYK
jgi:hypothetical protein